MKEVKSFCYLCLAECAINITIEQSKVIKILPDKSNVISNGYICHKAQHLIDIYNNNNRITSPMKRLEDSTLIDITWEQAFSEIADILKTSKKTMYMSSVYPSSNGNNSYIYSLLRLLNITDVSNVLSFEKAESLSGSVFKYRPITDTKSADVVIIIGQNTWVTQHMPQARKLLHSIKNNPNRKLFVVDPLVNKTSKLADTHYQILPGSNKWFLLALIKILINHSLINLDEIEKRTTNLHTLIKKLNYINVDNCLSRCNLTYESVLSLAKDIHNSKVLSIETGNGVCHSADAESVHYLISVLLTLTNNIPLRRDHFLMGNSFIWPVSNKDISTTLEKAECIIIDNSNPVHRACNSSVITENIKNTNFVVCLDNTFTASTDLADYILPTPTFIERTEIINTLSHDINQLQLSSKILNNTNTKTSSKIIETLINSITYCNDDYVKLLIDTYNIFDKHNENFYLRLLKYKYDLGIDQSVINNSVYIIKNTITKNFSEPGLFAVAWLEIFDHYIDGSEDPYEADYLKIYHFAEETTKKIIQLQNEGYCDINLSYNHNLSNNINLVPIHLEETIANLLNYEINNEYKYILLSGIRDDDTINNVYNNSTSVAKISSNIAEELNISEGQNITLVTYSGKITCNCTILDELPKDVVALNNNKQMNYLTKDNQSKYIPVNIVK